MVKSHEKKCRNYFRVTMITTSDMVKCRGNVNFEEMDTQRLTGKMMEFDNCEEYLRSISKKILSWQC